MLLWEGPPQFLVWFPERPQPVHHCPLTSSTSYSNRMESAEAVAAEVSRSRSTTIEISNMTDKYCLVNPRYVPALWDGLGKALIVFNMSQCFSGYILKVGKRTTHLSPRFAPWCQRFAPSPSPAAFRPAALACWHTISWRGLGMILWRHWPSCSPSPGTTTFTTTCLQWASLKKVLNVMRGCINKCTMRRNKRSMDLSGIRPVGRESITLGVTWISRPQWIHWVTQSWRWRCGINFSHPRNSKVSQTSLNKHSSVMSPYISFNPSICSFYRADCV